MLLAVMVGLASACARPSGDVGGQSREGPLVWPSGQTRLVASYAVGGGFVSYSWHVMEVPRLFVYTDGHAVADSRRTLLLTATELSDLVRALRRDLSGLGASVSPSGGMQVADAPTTVLAVRNGTGALRSVSAYALGIQDGYPRQLVAARDRLEAVAKRVVAEGTAYNSDRLRLVAEPRQESGPGPVRLWPATVPVPPLLAGGGGLRTADLTGAAAANAAARLPGADWQSGGQWPLLRSADGKLYGVAWRYLLPDE